MNVSHATGLGGGSRRSSTSYCVTRQPLLIKHLRVCAQTFEVHVPVRSGRGCSKKIGYTNPYPGSRTFLLRSDHPDLLQFKEDRFQVRSESGKRVVPRDQCFD